MKVVVKKCSDINCKFFGWYQNEINNTFDVNKIFIDSHENLYQLSTDNSRFIRGDDCYLIDEYRNFKLTEILNS